MNGKDFWWLLWRLQTLFWILAYSTATPFLCSSCQKEWTRLMSCSSCSGFMSVWLPCLWTSPKRSGNWRATSALRIFHVTPCATALAKASSWFLRFSKLNLPLEVIFRFPWAAPWKIILNAMLVWDPWRLRTLIKLPSISPSLPPACSTNFMFQLISSGSNTSTPREETRFKTNPEATMLSIKLWTSTMLMPEPSLFFGWHPTCLHCIWALYKNPCFSSRFKAVSVAWTSRSPCSWACSTNLPISFRSHGGMDIAMIYVQRLNPINKPSY